jgi:TonB family protein
VVLAHELAHIGRQDWLCHLAAEALRAAYWFNPLLWILARRLRVESEQACDDAVLATGLDGSTYATHLLDLARALRSDSRQFRLPASAMARPSSLEGRIRVMLNTHLDRRPVSWRTRLVSLAVLSALTLSLAGLRAQSVFYSLKGTVLDPTDRVLPGTTLVLTNGTTDAKYELKSDATGRFEFVGLPQGTYTLGASRVGFATLKVQDLSVSGDLERDLRLQVGTLEETITVTDGNLPRIQPDAATLQKREDASRRLAQRMQEEQARCAAGGATSPVGGVILPPAKLLDVRPVYPEYLKTSKVSGTVRMNAVIGTDGLVREIDDLNGPHPDLETAATDAVRQWQFSPTLLNCQPIDVRMNVTVNFAVQP